MYLISSLPVELNDNILIFLQNFYLAVQFQRFWAAGQLYNKDSGMSKVPEYIVPYLTMDKKYNMLREASGSRFDIVKLLLLDPRIDPSVQDNLVFCEASIYGNFDVVKLLLSDPRIDPSTRNNEAIIWASDKGS